MADLVTRMRLDSAEYDQKLKRAQQNLLAFEQQCRSAGQSITSMKKENVEYVRAMGQMETVSKNTRGKISELTNAFTELSVMYNRMTSEEKQSPLGQAMAHSISQLNTRLTTLKGELNGVGRELSQAGTNSNMFTKSISNAFSQFGPAAMAMTAVTSAVYGLKNALGGLIQTNMAFEQATATLSAIMGKSVSEISDLTNQAKQLGATTQYTAIQITELQTNLARLGFSSEEILSSTKAVQALATATGSNLGEAATLAGTALRGFGMNASEMERVASVLAVSTTKSALSFEKLATGLPYVAAVAKQFGFSIEDAVTLLGKLADAGFDASMAATATRSILLNLADTNGKLGQSLGRPVSNIEELSQALIDFRDKGVDLATMLDLTDKRSVAAFATFVENAETLTTFKQSISGVSEELGAMVDKQLNTLQGSITILKSAWEGLTLSFEQSNGILTEIVKSMTGVVMATKSMYDNSKDLIDVLGGVGNAISTVVQHPLKQLQERIQLINIAIVMMKNLLGQTQQTSSGTSSPVNVFNPSLNNALFRNQSQYGMIPQTSSASPSSTINPAATPTKSGGKDKPEKLIDGGISGMKMFDIESVKTTESMSALRAQLSAFQKDLGEATNAADYRAAEQGIAHTKAQMGVQEIAVRMGLDTDSMLKLKADIDKQMQTAIGDKIVPIKIETEPHAAAELEEDGKNVTEAWQGATSVIRSVGSALSSIENPAGKVVAIIAEAIANIAGGYAAAIGKEGAKSKNIYAFIASAAAAIVEMGVAISAVKQQTKFAEGGVVKGSTYSNDQIPALLNAGEVVLNRAQVGHLASVLSEDNAGTSSQPYVSGEQIYLGLNNYLRRTGRGEMITSR